MKWSGVHPSVCLSVPSLKQQWRAAGLLLSTVLAGDISWHQRAPGAEQQRRRSTS